MTKNKLEYIQKWRGIAILLVILAHTTHHGMSPDIGIKYLDNFIWFGGQGVTLFFVISAFTIFYSLDMEKQSLGKNNYKSFLIKRFFRIAPLYYLGIVIYKFAFFQNTEIDKELFLNVVFLHWLSPTAIDSVVPGGWSITTEFTFYFVAPLIFSYIKNIKGAVNCFLVAIIASRVLVAVLTKIYPNADSVYYRLNPLCQFPIFFIGIILYYVILKKERISLSPLQCLLIAFIIFAEQIFGFILRDYYLYGIMFGVLVYFTSRFDFNKTVGKPLAFIGELSFTLYVMHFLVKWLLRDFGIIDPLDNSISAFSVRFLGTTFISILICLPIYHLFEKPLLTIGKKIASRFANVYPVVKKA